MEEFLTLPTGDPSKTLEEALGILPDTHFLWYGGTKVASTGTKLLITGAMRKSLTKVVEILVDLPILSMMVEAAALTSAYHLPGLDRKTLELGHGTMWKKGKKLDNKSVVTKYHTTQRYSINHIKWLYLPSKSGRKTGSSGWKKGRSGSQTKLLMSRAWEQEDANWKVKDNSTFYWDRKRQSSQPR